MQTLGSLATSTAASEPLAVTNCKPCNETQDLGIHHSLFGDHHTSMANYVDRSVNYIPYTYIDMEKGSYNGSHHKETRTQSWSRQFGLRTGPYELSIVAQGSARPSTTWDWQVIRCRTIGLLWLLSLCSTAIPLSPCLGSLLRMDTTQRSS